MNELLFVLLIAAIFLAVKYYLFDLPHKDKLMYELNEIRDDLDLLVKDGKINISTPEYNLLYTFLEHQYLLVKYGITFKFVTNLYSDELPNNQLEKTEKVINSISQNNESLGILTSLNSFLAVNIVPIISRKFSILNATFRILKVFSGLGKFLSSLNNFSLNKKIKDVDKDFIAKEIITYKFS